MNCVKCKAALPEGAIYCPMCGKKQVPEKRKALKRANGTGTVYKLQGRRKRPWVAAKNKVVIGYYERKTDALETLERLSGKDLTERYKPSTLQIPLRRSCCTALSNLFRKAAAWVSKAYDVSIIHI